MRKFEYSKFSNKGWTAHLHWPESCSGAHKMVFEGVDGYASIATNLSASMSESWQQEESNKQQFDEAYDRAIHKLTAACATERNRDESLRS